MSVCLAKPFPELFPRRLAHRMGGRNADLIRKSALIIVSANFPLQEGRARVFLEERQAV